MKQKTTNRFIISLSYILNEVNFLKNIVLAFETTNLQRFSTFSKVFSLSKNEKITFSIFCLKYKDFIDIMLEYIASLSI